MTLGDYLALNARKPRVSGQHDCATFPADWVVECGHPDPMAKWRGTYASEAGAEFLIADAGGLTALFGEGLAALPNVSEFQAGDIGVISLLGEEAGSIFTGQRWAFVADRGLAFASLSLGSVLYAWRP